MKKIIKNASIILIIIIFAYSSVKWCVNYHYNQLDKDYKNIGTEYTYFQLNNEIKDFISTR